VASPKTQRKLTAILCADVVGYSRLMGASHAAMFPVARKPSQAIKIRR